MRPVSCTTVSPGSSCCSRTRLTRTKYQLRCRRGGRLVSGMIPSTCALRQDIFRAHLPHSRSVLLAPTTSTRVPSPLHLSSSASRRIHGTLCPCGLCPSSRASLFSLSLDPSTMTRRTWLFNPASGRRGVRILPYRPRNC